MFLTIVRLPPRIHAHNNCDTFSRMAERRSVKGLARSALAQDRAARADLKKQQREYFKKQGDSFQNFAAALGIGTQNLLSTATYGFNPITRVRTMLEWIHRGSWLGGVAVDLVADDMTRAGISIDADFEPDEISAIEEAATGLQVWSQINDAIKWSRLYGGCLAVMMINGQDWSKPLRIETVGKGQFRGLMVLDRWQVEPSLERLVMEQGPHIGLPEFYTITNDAPSFSGKRIHHSRCLRLEGIRLPYWQRLMENLWGISIIERLNDRMIAFDSASTGAAQLVYKAYLRTYKIKGLRELIAAGGPLYQALLRQVAFMRQTQSSEGITLLDGEDDFSGQQGAASSFSGIGEALTQFAQQIAGALQIPLTRLFGQSPAGLNATGESDLRTYYDGINQQQERHLRPSVTLIYRAIAQSEGLTVPDGFRISFRPLWQLTDEQKAEIADRDTERVMKVKDSGLVSDRTLVKELKQNSKVTGAWSNITKEEINQAAEIPAPPLPFGAPGMEMEVPDMEAPPPMDHAADAAIAAKIQQNFKGMRVPVGGSMCEGCQFLADAEKGICGNADFIAWDGSKSDPPKPAGSDKIPAPINAYCSNWFWPKDKPLPS